MKKQILALTMCLALTSTTALAVGAKTVAQKSTVQKAVAAAPGNPLIPSLAKPGEQPQIISREEAKKRMGAAKAKERELLYTALNLSVEQKTKAEALDAKTKAGVVQVIKKLQLEARKLRELQSKHASVFAVWKQELALKAAKKDVEKYFKSSRKEFEAILTKEQKAKFEIIDAAKRKEMENFKKEHKHGGPNKMGHKPPVGDGPEHMGPPPQGMGPKGSYGPESMGPPPPPPEDKK
jgi:hypothetical protein